MTLSELSKRLHNISNQKKLVKILEKPLQIMFFHILYDIAKMQAPDTSQARMNIIRRCADKLGGDYSTMADNLIKSYEYWWRHGYPENADRSPENISESKVIMTNGIFHWSSTDAGIIQQEISKSDSSISTQVTDMSGNPRDNNGLHSNHITRVSNDYNNGIYDKIIDKHIEQYIKNYIENGVVMSE